MPPLTDRIRSLQGAISALKQELNKEKSRLQYEIQKTWELALSTPAGLQILQILNATSNSEPQMIQPSLMYQMPLMYSTSMNYPQALSNKVNTQTGMIWSLPDVRSAPQPVARPRTSAPAWRDHYAWQENQLHQEAARAAMNQERFRRRLLEVEQLCKEELRRIQNNLIFNNSCSEDSEEEHCDPHHVKSAPSGWSCNEKHSSEDRRRPMNVSATSMSEHSYPRSFHDVYYT